MKHIGKHGDRKVAVVYRTVPGEEHMALVIYPDTLPRAFHDSIMKVIEGEIGQDATELSDAMFRSLLADGRPMLQTLHKEGMIKKVNTNQIIVTPNATSHVRLDELNEIFDGMEAGGDAADKMADLDANAGLIDPVANRVKAQASDDVIDDATLGTQMLDQSAQLAAEGASLVAESKRLKKEAIKLNPELKPKAKWTAKKTAKKKVAKKKATTKKS